MSAATGTFALFLRRLIKPFQLRSYSLYASLRVKENQETVNISKKVDTFHNFLKKIDLRKSDQGLSSSRKVVGVVSKLPETIPRNLNNIKFKTDEVCDQKVVEDLNKFGVNKALETLKYYAGANRYPSRKTCMNLLQLLLKNLDLEGIDEVRNVIKEAYPQEYQWQMGYEHYIAEYHWKMRNYAKAIEIFDNLFANFPQRRKKLSDMLQFMARKIINEESEEQVKKLIEFVGSLIRKHSTHHPSINVWFLLFLSEKGVYNNLSQTILGIKPEKTSPFVLNKIDSILKLAHEKNNIDYIQRLVECVLFLQAKTEYTKVFSSLLQHQCQIGDAKSAQETFRYCNNEGITLSGNSIVEYSKLVTPSSNKHPEGAMKKPTKEFEFKF